MKKFIYLLAGVGMAAAMSSCADTEKPVFQEPTTFTVNVPALQNEYLATTSNLEDKSTFNLVCNQPDYGFAAQAVYGAQVSLTGDFNDEITDENGEVVTPATFRTLGNQDANNASMSIRTYDLAVAMCQLLGIEDEDSWSDYIANDGAQTVKIYLRATCQIAGVPNSFIASSNTVSYNYVQLSYAVPVAGRIWYVGDTNLPNPDKEGQYLNFVAPIASNAAWYNDNGFALIEPEIGCKIYAGTITLPETDKIHSVTDGTDYVTNWRFFTELNGWDDASYMIGSYPDDFYKVNITGEFSPAFPEEGAYYTGEGVYGKGNWGVWLAEDTPVTMAVNLIDAAKPKVYFKVGVWDVVLGQDAGGMTVPEFVTPSAEE